MTKNDLKNQTVIVVTHGDAQAREFDQVLRNAGYVQANGTAAGGENDRVWIHDDQFFWFSSRYSQFLQYKQMSVSQYIAAVDETLLFSPGEKALHKRFNELSERMDRLTALVEKIAAEIVPKDSIDKGKPGLKG